MQYILDPTDHEWQLLTEFLPVWDRSDILIYMWNWSDTVQMVVWMPAICWNICDYNLQNGSKKQFSLQCHRRTNFGFPENLDLQWTVVKK